MGNVTPCMELSYVSVPLSVPVTCKTSSIYINFGTLRLAVDKHCVEMTATVTLFQWFLQFYVFASHVARSYVDAFVKNHEPLSRILLVMLFSICNEK